MPGGRIDILVEPDTRGFPNKLASGLRSASGIASTIGRGLGLAVAAGTAIAAVGLKSVIALGNEYTGNLNEMQAVSGATAQQMAKVGQTAKALGADMTLPATSAADAAAAMVELAKGGLTVDEAMKAAKGTLQLAAAAQVDGATAAEIQSSALNAFGLSADKAGKVADVLANTANAAAGSIVDIGNSMKYVAPVAAALKIPIEDTASAIGLLANQGVKGEQAGTSLRGILASLASPSAAAKEAMDALGLSVFDAQGKFVGLRAFTDQLAQAKGRLTDADFAAAASTAFGNEGLTAANALAAEGAAGFDSMATAVSRTGGAADVAAAQTKGLGGAWEGFKSQLETAGIAVYEVIAPGLEQATRSAADFVSKFTPTVVNGLQTAIAAGSLFGPALADAIRAKAAALVGVGRDIIEPLADGLKDSLNSAVNLGITVFGGFADVVRAGADAVVPFAEGVGDLLEGLNQATGPVGALVAGLELVYDATAGVVRIVSPAVELVGGLASAFGSLPGPIQTAVVGMLALKVGPALLGGLKSAFSGVKTEAGEASKQTGILGRTLSTVTAPVRGVVSGLGSVVGTVRQFNDEARVQRAVADQAGESVGRLGGYAAAFNVSTVPAVAAARGFAEQTSAIRDGAAAAGEPISAMGAAVGTLVERSPALSAMKTAFDDASAGADRFGRTAGIAAAAGSGLKSAGAGLISALGGPWGVALGVASAGLSLLAGANERAAAKEAAHRQAVDSLADALRESNGAITENVKLLAYQRLEQEGAINLARDLGIPTKTLTDAYLGNKDALTQVQSALDGYLKKVEGQGQLEGQVAGQNPLADKAHDLKNILNDLIPEMDAAQQKNKELAELNGEVGESMFGATERGRDLGDAMRVLADNTSTADAKARALKDALDALSGGNITLEQAQSRANETLARLSDLFGENLDKAKGWGDALLNADGSINSTTENGRALLNTMDDLGTSMADVAQKTYDAAIAAGDDIPTAMGKAQVAAQGLRDGFTAQGDALGLLPAQVQALADRYGLVPSTVATLITSPGMDATQVELILLKSLVDQVPPEKPIVVKSLSDEAKQKLLDIGFTVNTLPNGDVEVVANTQAAKDALAEVTKPRTVTITAIYGSAVKTPYGTMNPLGSYGALGNITTAAYAKGGVHQKLQPMKAGLAAVVPPNTWRVVGDRLRDDEFYIPDNNDSRSVALGLEWARRRGFVLARTFAAGGVASTAGPAAGAGMNKWGAPPIIQHNNFPPSVDPEQVANIVMDRLAWRQ